MRSVRPESSATDAEIVIILPSGQLLFLVVVVVVVVVIFVLGEILHLY